MDKTKYKSVVVDRETYDIISHLSDKSQKSIASEVKKYLLLGLESEADEANLDCMLESGGTPRLKRLMGDLDWLRLHAGVFWDDEFATKKKDIIIDKEESRALDILREMVFDCVG